MTAPSRNSAAYQRFLQTVEEAHPDGEIVVVTDNLSSHHSMATRTWLEDHPGSPRTSSRWARRG